MEALSAAAPQPRGPSRRKPPPGRPPPWPPNQRQARILKGVTAALARCAIKYLIPPSPQGTVLRTSPRPQVQAGPPTARCWPCGAGAKPRWPWPCDQSSLQHAHVDMRRPRSRRHQPPVCRPARSSSSSEGDWFTRFQEARFLVTRNKISSYKKQEKLVWCVVEEGPSLHTMGGQFLRSSFLLRNWVRTSQSRE